MAKLFIQEIPTQEDMKLTTTQLLPDSNVGILYSNLLFMKVAAEMENNFDSVLSKYSLSSGRFTILYLLNNAEEGILPSELALRVGVTQATISGLLNNMDKAGLLTRNPHEKDGRSYVIKITDKGREVIKEILPQWYPQVQNFWKNFSEEEREGLNALLKRMMNQ